ncbi:MAG: 50S ribosomal protein L35 [Chloroflexi bacterium]|nr:50S ribosomal protein L35 [Chloroflexota bacterium]
MPKLKTHKGAKKRFHITGTGKLMRTKGPKSHFRMRKAKRMKRLLGGKVGINSPVMAKSIKQSLVGSSR